MRLLELQESNKEVRTIRAARELKEGYEEVEVILHHEELPFVPEAIRIKLISRHHDDLLAGHFGIDKTRELIGRKYYWSSFRKDVEACVKGCDVCLGSKAMVHYKGVQITIDAPDLAGGYTSF